MFHFSSRNRLTPQKPLIRKAKISRTTTTIALPCFAARSMAELSLSSFLSPIQATDEHVEIRGRGRLDRLIKGRNYQNITPLLRRETRHAVRDLLAVEHLQDQWMGITLLDQRDYAGPVSTGDRAGISRNAIKRWNVAYDRQRVGHDNSAMRLENDRIGQPVNAPGILDMLALHIV